jgi:4-aminobutyrate aminotransferase-like enzyme
MHGLILELAEQITARMPESLSVCMFVCTGSEANELAWRMSKLISGNSGALITKYSYHGNGDATTKLSTETIPQESLPSYIQTINAPTSNTSFREPDSGMESAIRIMNEQGHRPAMLMRRRDISVRSMPKHGPQVDYVWLMKFKRASDASASIFGALILMMWYPI